VARFKNDIQRAFTSCVVFQREGKVSGVTGDENGNIALLDLTKVVSQFKPTKNVPKSLNSYNPKRKYMQNCAKVADSFIVE